MLIGKLLVAKSNSKNLRKQEKLEYQPKRQKKSKVAIDTNKIVIAKEH